MIYDPRQGRSYLEDFGLAMMDGMANRTAEVVWRLMPVVLGPSAACLWRHSWQ
jgi:hypothetical protein